MSDPQIHSRTIALRTNAHGRNLHKALAAVTTAQEATPRAILQGAAVRGAAVQEDRDVDD